MFTGIIKATTRVKKHERKRGSLFLTLQTPKNWKVKPGNSIATNGVCLTVKTVGRGFYTTELMDETLKKTTFGPAVPRKVNVERSLRLTDFLDGHLLQGHVDGTGKILKIEQKGSSKIYKFSFPQAFRKLLAPKGSIGVDGISLTVVDVGKGWFTVSLVDYTIKHTTLGQKKLDEWVNLEFDMIAKYLKQLVHPVK